MLLKIKNFKAETSDHISIIFQKPNGFFYYPGQYLDIKLPVVDERGNTRAFSISSSPTENFLMITFKKGISVFKKHLERLKIGDTIEASHPAGTFTLDETEPAVFITGGVGITPFRSMLKHATTNHLKTPITLLYSNSSNDFLFKNELDTYQTSNQHLKLTYQNTKENARITRTQLEPIVQLNGSALFYLSGSPSMVSDISNQLKTLGADEINIRTDAFDGYK